MIPFQNNILRIGFKAAPAHRMTASNHTDFSFYPLQHRARAFPEVSSKDQFDKFRVLNH
jgi:hypothetical protein